MSYLSRGQYRKVRNTDDGCPVWQCLWCKQCIELRCNPETRGFNFCMFCGKSWFRRLMCRNHEVPRWAYEKWGNEPPHNANIWCNTQHEVTSIWVIEWRSNMFGVWCGWQLELDCDKDPCKPDYKWAYSVLNQKRLDRNYPDDESGIQYQYRARLIKKKDLTFDACGVDFSNRTTEQKLI